MVALPEVARRTGGSSAIPARRAVLGVFVLRISERGLGCLLQPQIPAPFGDSIRAFHLSSLCGRGLGATQFQREHPVRVLWFGCFRNQTPTPQTGVAPQFLSALVPVNDFRLFHHLAEVSCCFPRAQQLQRFCNSQRALNCFLLCNVSRFK
jgi:hypothetical protein